MSLYELADGILETHVTWEDVERHLQKNLDTKAKFGDKKKATNISDMKGFMSRIALIDPDWRDVEERKELPDRFIVKISSQIPLLTLSEIMKYEGEEGFSEDTMKKLARITRECHNREVEVYKLLQRFNHPDVPYTKVYALKSFESPDDLKGYLIAAFVPNVHTIGMFRPIPSDELETLVRGIGTFSALFERLSAEEKKFAGGEDYLEMVFKDFLPEGKLENTFKNLKATMGEEHGEKCERLVEIYWHYNRLVPRYSELSKLLGFKKVLNHGDLWQSNMLHSLGEDGKMKLEAMIDWQGCSIVSPGLDTSRLLMGCLSTQDCRKNGKRLLKIYHDAFTSTYGEELFSMEELLDAYNLFFPMAAMLIQPGLLPFFNRADIPEPERSEVRKIVMDKLLGVMDDVFEIHEHNLKRFPDFMEL